MFDAYLAYLPPELRALPWQFHPLDGKLLLFERHTGLNVLLEGDETAHLRRTAPRTLLIALTNVCNLTCSFCYRDLENRSLWRYESLLQFCQDAAQWGVLEVAFGGGEPLLFALWPDFISELYETTELCINFTTNGTLLTDEFLRAIAGKYGQIRVSLYEDNHWPQTITMLARNQARFGVNWMITPSELSHIERKFGELWSLGVRDFLLIGYKGEDHTLHLQPDEIRQFSAFVNKVHTAFGSSVTLKLDVCWGDALPDVPRLFQSSDCGAGDEFLSITSDKHVKGCSFMATPTGMAFETVEDLKRIWTMLRTTRQPAYTGGCARLPGRGLTNGGTSGAIIHLAAVQ